MITKFELFETHDNIFVRCIDTGRLKNIQIGDIFQVSWHHDSGWYLTDVNPANAYRYSRPTSNLTVQPKSHREGKDSKIWVHPWGAIFSTVDKSMDEYKKRIREEQFDL